MKGIEKKIGKINAETHMSSKGAQHFLQHLLFLKKGTPYVHFIILLTPHIILKTVYAEFSFHFFLLRIYSQHKLIHPFIEV